MSLRLRLLTALAMAGFASFFNFRQAVDWSRRETPPLNRFIEDVRAAIPHDGRVLLVASSSRMGSEDRRLAAALYPRVVYGLPPGTRDLEDARAWAAARQLGWAVSLGGAVTYDPARAWIRRLDGGR